jgi:outer membrane protein OmpA-like peptidoglycan-associated protein
MIKDINIALKIVLPIIVLSVFVVHINAQTPSSTSVLTRDQQIEKLKSELQQIRKNTPVETNLEGDAVRSLDSDNGSAYEQDLKNALINAKLRREKNSIKTFVLREGVFEYGTANITPKSKDLIWRLSEVIKKTNYNKVVVEGHTDSNGDPLENLELSRARAKAVFDELDRYEIKNIEYIGFGSMMPAASNNKVAGREKNRRIEIYVE